MTLALWILDLADHAMDWETVLESTIWNSTILALSVLQFAVHLLDWGPTAWESTVGATDSLD